MTRFFAYLSNTSEKFTCFSKKYFSKKYFSPNHHLIHPDAIGHRSKTPRSNTPSRDPPLPSAEAHTFSANPLLSSSIYRQPPPSSYPRPPPPHTSPFKIIPPLSFIKARAFNPDLIPNFDPDPKLDLGHDKSGNPTLILDPRPTL